MGAAQAVAPLPHHHHQQQRQQQQQRGQPHQQHQHHRPQKPLAAAGSRTELWPMALAHAEGAVPAAAAAAVVAPGVALSPGSAQQRASGNGANGSGVTVAVAAESLLAAEQPGSPHLDVVPVPAGAEPAPSADPAASTADAAAAAAVVLHAHGQGPAEPKTDGRWERVMAAITCHCYSVRQLFTIVNEPSNSASMRAAHYAAALHKLPQLADAAAQRQAWGASGTPAGGGGGGAAGGGAAALQRPARLTAQLLSGFQQRIHEACGRDLADAAAGAAKAGVVPRRAWARAFRAAAAVQLERGELDTKELLRILWAAAKLHQRESELSEAAARRMLQQLRDGEGPGGGGAAAGPGGGGDEDRTAATALAPAWAPRAAWLAPFAAALLPALPKLDPWGLSLAAWAFGALGYDPGAAWWASFLPSAEALARQGRFAPQQLSNTMWALAKLGLRPGGAEPAADGLWRTLFAVSEPLLAYGAFTPQGIANMAWAAAKAGAAPPAAWVHGLVAAAHVDMGGFCAQNLANTLWALARLSQQHARAQAQACQKAGHQQAGPLWEQQAEQQQEREQQEASAAAAAAAAAATEPPSVAAVERQQRYEALRRRRARRRGSPAADAFAPSSEWMERFWGQLACVESDLEPQGLSSVLWALAVMGLRPAGRCAAGAAWGPHGAAHGSLFLLFTCVGP
jgi:hypothetical protein